MEITGSGRAGGSLGKKKTVTRSKGSVYLFVFLSYRDMSRAILSLCFVLPYFIYGCVIIP